MLEGKQAHAEEDLKLTAGVVFHVQDLSSTQGDLHTGSSLASLSCEPPPKTFAEHTFLRGDHIPAMRQASLQTRVSRFVVINAALLRQFPFSSIECLAHKF